MVAQKKMRNDKLNTKQYFGQYFYAISRARLVIRSGSSILLYYPNTGIPIFTIPLIN